MLLKKFPLIAREGWPVLFVVVLLAAGLIYAEQYVWAIALSLLLLLLLFLLRDPARNVPALPLAVVSPVDGVVRRVASTVDPFLSTSTTLIELQMNPLTDVYSLRSPIEGRLQQQWHGASASTDVKYAQCVQTDEKDRIVWGVAAGSWMRPRCYAYPGDRLGQGQRCGYLPLGGRVLVWIPADSRVKIKQGDKVLAGETELATLVHQSAVSSITEEGSL
ncbi:MAG: hypothetical protein OEW58_06805 [Gammaproteobacteria bacterium]|nr:hypothetical protein [Gammaproteobacteria bacterium]